MVNFKAPYGEVGLNNVSSVVAFFDSIFPCTAEEDAKIIF